MNLSVVYAKKITFNQKKTSSNAAAVLDSSAQNESLQRKADMANNATQHAEAPRPNNTGMPDNLKAGIESLSGFSMDNVRVHYNSSKPATVQALAYTQGTDIHVAPGQEKCLPHEAWHVAQQMAGRVSPTTNINGMPVNDNAALEHEADVMGENAVQCKKNSSLMFSKNVFENVVQCQKYNLRTGDFPKNWPTKFLPTGKSVESRKEEIPEIGCVYSNLLCGNNELCKGVEFAKQNALGRAGVKNVDKLHSHEFNLENGTMKLYWALPKKKPPKQSCIGIEVEAKGYVYHEGHNNVSVIKKTTDGIIIKENPAHCHAVSLKIFQYANGSFYCLEKEYTNIGGEDVHFLIEPPFNV
nr:DUF4157 domain-containing protein [Fibrobacter sp. UWB2]